MTDDAARIAELEAEVATLRAQLAEQAHRTNALVARSQEQLYWLERWHVDLNAVMRHRPARAALEALRAARVPVRRGRRAYRRYRYR